MEQIKILIISGSVREKSYTRSLAENIANVLEKKGAQVTHWNLREKPLPIMSPELREDVANHPDKSVREYAALALSADAFVFASPIYHNSYSGVLKNAIDHLRTPHFSYKPVGLVSHGGDRSKQSVDHLRIVARAINSIAIPTNVCVDENDFEGYEIKNEEIIKRVDQFCEELILLAQTMLPLRKEKAVKNK
jgi:NAD(P)H-dependent FMN reductase